MMPALSMGDSTVRAPLSVAQITKAAQEYDYSAQTALRIWLRTADLMLKQVSLLYGQSCSALSI